MKTFRFEIQDLIEVKEEAETRAEARDKVVHKLSIGHYELDENGTATISDGVEED